jgi:phosphatidate cytidylyltransferase
MTAAAALPLFLLLVYKGSPFLFASFIAVVSILALKEYYHIVCQTLGRTVKGAIPYVGYITAVAIACAAFVNSPQIVVNLIVVNLMIAVLISLTQVKSDTRVLELVIRQSLGIVYIPGFLSYLILIRNGTDGVSWLFFLFSVVFIGDATAYYAGSLFGKHKLSPLVSPGKTIEGSVAGLCAGIGAGLICKHILELSFSWSPCFILSVLIGVCAQIGDLFESQLKRAANLKDSGGILPGHGGTLDRIDATLFSVPILYIFKEFVL